MWSRYVPADSQVFTPGASYEGMNWPGTQNVNYRGAVPPDFPPYQPKPPDRFSLQQNYPNPFNPGTKISFSLSQSGFTTLKIYDVVGREVTTLVSEKLDAGPHTANWEASDHSSGIYFYQLKSGRFIETKKMILMR
jgi:hypothetical protein